MAEKHKRKSSTTKTENRVAEITERLEQGIQELFESDRYKAYLKTMAKFYDYSVNNTILIAMQNPAATMVAGYQAWQNKFGRYVKAGEKGIRILAPMPYKVKIEKEQADPQTGQTIKNEDGDPVTEMVDESVCMAFVSLRCSIYRRQRERSFRLWEYRNYPEM